MGMNMGMGMVCRGGSDALLCGGGGASTTSPATSMLVSPRMGLKPGAAGTSGTTGATIVPKIPTLEDTLDSSLLREFFIKSFARMRLTEEEEALWDATSAFHKKYSHLAGNEVMAKQAEARKEAREIIDKHGSLMRDPAKLRQQIEGTKFVSHNLFREEELALFKRQHTAFETMLAKKGWQ